MRVAELMPKTNGQRCVLVTQKARLVKEYIYDRPKTNVHIGG